MKSMEIEVMGAAEVTLLPDWAKIKLVVSHDDSREIKAVLASAQAIEARLRELSTEGTNKKGVVEYQSWPSVSELSRSACRDGRPSPRFRARVDFDILLQKFDQANIIIDELIAIEHTRCQGVAWVFTLETQEQQRSKLRSMAASNAKLKAMDYAVTLGYGRVGAIGVREEPTQTITTSQQDSGPHLIDGVLQQQSMAAAEGWEEVGGDVTPRRPDKIKMVQAVHVKFQADMPI